MVSGTAGRFYDEGRWQGTDQFGQMMGQRESDAEPRPHVFRIFFLSLTGIPADKILVTGPILRIHFRAQAGRQDGKNRYVYRDEMYFVPGMIGVFGKQLL